MPVTCSSSAEAVAKMRVRVVVEARRQRELRQLQVNQLLNQLN